MCTVPIATMSGARPGPALHPGLGHLCCAATSVPLDCVQYAHEGTRTPCAPGAGESKHAPQLSAMRRVVHRRHMAEAFRTQVLQSKESSAPPVVTLGSCSFLWTREVRSSKPCVSSPA